MKNLKRIFALTLALLFIVPLYAACKKGSGGSKDDDEKTFGYASAKKCAEEAYLNYVKGEYELAYYAFPKEYVRCCLKERNISESDFLTALSSASKEYKERLKNNGIAVGKVTSGEANELRSSVIEDAAEEFDLEVEEGSKVFVSAEYTRDSKSGTESEEVNVFKIDGKWYVDPEIFSWLLKLAEKHLPEPTPKTEGCDPVTVTKFGVELSSEDWE